MAVMLLLGGDGVTQGQTPLSASRPLVFDQVAVVDVTTGRVQAGQRVVIIGTRIRALGDARTVKSPRGARMIDARGKYLIPGLWDMHVHVDGMDQPDSVFLAHGITGIREMSQNQDRPAEGWASGSTGAVAPGESPRGFAAVLARRRQIARGERIGPRLVATTHDFYSPQCEVSLLQQYAALLPGGRCTEPSFVVTSPAQARRLVDSLQAIGVDFVKPHIVADRAVYFAILREARRLGLPVVGHLSATEQPRTATELEASDSGLRSVEHISEMGCWVTDWQKAYEGGVAAPDSVAEPRCREVVAHFRRNGTWLVPTLVYERDRGGEARFRQAQHAVGLVHRLGMPLLAGSDATMLPPPLIGVALHDELALLVGAGLTPLEALQTATRNVAEFFGATDSLGTVEAGKVADLVLLDANPLADIQNTTKIRAVIANGHYFDRAALDALPTTTSPVP